MQRARSRWYPAGPDPHNKATPPAGARNRTFHAAARRHRSRSIQQHANGHARLDLEHLEEHFVEAHEGAPVDRAQIVALMEMPVVEKLLAAAGEARPVMAADQPGEDCCQWMERRSRRSRNCWSSNGPVGQVGHSDLLYAAEACTLTPEMILVRMASGVLPSACASKFRMMRWRSTDGAISLISSMLRW